MKESDIQKAILDYLAATNVLAFRMNTGAIKIDKRFLRFGSPGMSDILAFPPKRRCFTSPDQWTEPVWIECKSSRGKQSELQKSFQEQVEARGHVYILAKSVDDVIAVLEPYL